MHATNIKIELRRALILTTHQQDKEALRGIDSASNFDVSFIDEADVWYATTLSGKLRLACKVIGYIFGVRS